MTRGLKSSDSWYRQRFELIYRKVCQKIPVAGLGLHP